MEINTDKERTKRAENLLDTLNMLDPFIREGFTQFVRNSPGMQISENTFTLWYSKHQNIDGKRVVLTVFGPSGSEWLCECDDHVANGSCSHVQEAALIWKKSLS